MAMNEKKKKDGSAMSQVGGKVNAGVMDAVTCGGMCEGAEPDSDEYYLAGQGDGYYHAITEDKEKDEFDYKKYMKMISEYMASHGLNVKPFPKVQLDDSKQEGLFIKTGYYAPEEKLVVLFINERHPKDILRSFAHEMIHHHQNLSGKNLSFSDADNVKDNKELEKLEAEAYLKGNIFFRKWTEYFRKGNKEPLQESKMLDEMSASEVDLSSFKLKRELNPKFWVDGHLDSRIRMKLLDIADDFIKSLEVEWADAKDITMSGSLANYNWDKKYSDIDIHVIMNFDDVDDNKEFVQAYFDAKKDLWNSKHEDLKIFGFSVEVYVRDVDDKENSSGIYSLDKDKWIDKPTYNKLDSFKTNKEHVKQCVAKYATRIDNLEDDYEKADGDSHKLEDIYEKASKLFDEIKDERKKGFDKSSNEMNDGNVIFKALRRMDYIGKIVDLKQKTYNIINSLD